MKETRPAAPCAKDGPHAAPDSRSLPREACHGFLEAAGFDYCMIDMEHGAFDLETIADLAALPACRSGSDPACSTSPSRCGHRRQAAAQRGRAVVRVATRRCFY